MYSQHNSDFVDPNNSDTAPSSLPNSNLDRDLFNDLVEIVPLVQSLIDRKASRSFTRRGSMIYTKTPTIGSLSKRGTDLKGRNIGQSIPIKKKVDHGEKEQGKNGSQNSDADFSMFSSRTLTSDKDTEDLIILKEQVEELQKKLWEKDELLKSAENSREQMFNAKLEELKHQTLEKDSLLKYTQQQLIDAKIKLADKQAALEKIQWEAMTSTKKVENLQNELDSVQTDISSFTLLLEGLAKINTAGCTEDYDTKPYDFTHLPSIDDLDEMDLQKMEEARKTYIAAVAVAKERRDEESIAAATSARLHLQSFIFKSTNVNL
ncbi:hypothetical protein TanjilG_18489 [Lupinus angustifolius]|uniref:Movement protein binding protein 2C n=1 Tax=Lupinus angustifolius TaxID=3871 RepID=A0A4P1RX65_LUPAN|nr:PREDICTED: uncharacterized protein LOC109344704 [Lupinus angustifolius]OIW19679.1 hypothetical protein TanjilG_18489 [Lupinus angustifolius]